MPPALSVAVSVLSCRRPVGSLADPSAAPPLFVVDETMESPLLRYRLLVNQQNLRTPDTGLETRLLHSDETSPVNMGIVNRPPCTSCITTGVSNL